MNNQSDDKRIKKAKEIRDLISERDEIQRLLCGGSWRELNAYLQKLNVKYMAETVTYNLANPNPPSNLEENAHNCINFLNVLLTAKVADNSQ